MFALGAFCVNEVMMKAILCCLFLVVFSGTLSAEEQKPFEYLQEIKEVINGIKKVAPENYMNEMPDFRKKVERYIRYKNGLCNGEFSSIVLQSEVDGSEKDKNLSREERAFCIKELEAIQISFINHSFLARKKHIKYMHELELKELDEMRIKTLNELKQSFKRKLTPKVRSGRKRSS